jgi:hypothetical protein
MISLDAIKDFGPWAIFSWLVLAQLVIPLATKMLPAAQRRAVVVEDRKLDIEDRRVDELAKIADAVLVSNERMAAIEKSVDMYGSGHGLIVSNQAEIIRVLGEITRYVAIREDRFAGGREVRKDM